MIRIGNSSEHVILKDFAEEGSEIGYKSTSLEFLRGTIALQLSGISTNIRATFRIDELQSLELNLIQLNNDLKTGFSFENLEDNISIAVTPIIGGHLTIKGYIRNRDYSGTTNFSIETDQSYLPGTIGQVKSLLKEINQKYVPQHRL